MVSASAACLAFSCSFGFSLSVCLLLDHHGLLRHSPTFPFWSVSVSVVLGQGDCAGFGHSNALWVHCCWGCHLHMSGFHLPFFRASPPWGQFVLAFPLSCPRPLDF